MYISLLYTLGSAVFLAASILFYPYFSIDPFLYLAAVCGFVVGSVVFTWAGTLSVWGAMRLHAGDVSVWGAAILSLMGALLLLAGSLAFWPDLSPDGATIGAYTFRAGSIAYMLSSGWRLYAMWMAMPAPRRFDQAALRQVITLVCYTGGALNFIAGSMTYLRGGAVLGSTLWALGSLIFLVGSAMPLRRLRVSLDPQSEAVQLRTVSSTGFRSTGHGR